MINKDYSDIINLPHFQSKKHKQMSRYERAAQFAPFAALTGYDEQVKETRREVSQKRELSEDEISELNKQLNYLKQHLHEKPLILLTYFKKDPKKQGGQYLEVETTILKVDDINQQLVLNDGLIVKFIDLEKIAINN